MIGRQSATISRPLLTLEEIAGYLKVSQKTILRMVRAGELPGLKVSNQWRFPRTAINDWLIARMQYVPSKKLVDIISTKRPLLSLLRFIPPNRILMNVTPGSKEDVLGQLVVPLVEDGAVADPEPYRAALLEREQTVSTAIADGVAVPHARTPERSGLRTDCVVVARCAPGTDFAALDGKPTHLFFLVGSTTTEAHLRLMASIMLMLRIPGLKNGLLSAGDKDAVRGLLAKAHNDLSVQV